MGNYPAYLRASLKTKKPIIYIDMDGVLCDFDKRKFELEEKGIKGHSIFKHADAYRDLDPIEGAIDSWNILQQDFETYVLSTPAWSNPDSWSEKRKWVEKFLGKSATKKLILSHNKGLLLGDYLIDDRIANGVLDFGGEHIHFGEEKFKDWGIITPYLIRQLEYSDYIKGK